MSQGKTNINWGNVAIGVGVTAGAYVAYKLFSDEQERKEYNSFLEQWCGENLDESLLTHDLPWYSQSADRIANAVWRNGGGWTEDDGTIKNILLQLNNDMDWTKLACVYKIRGPWFLIQKLTTPAMNLSATVDKYLNESMKVEVNEDWISKGMEPFLIDE